MKNLNHSAAALHQFTSGPSTASFAKAIEPPFAKAIEPPFAMSIDPPFAANA